MEVLGFNSILLLAQLISFGFLFFVLKKFLYSNIKKSLEERRAKIQDITIKNSEVEKRLLELEQEKINLEKKNQDELRKLILQSQKEAEEIKKDILNQAESKSKKIIEEAAERIKQERAKASDSLKGEAGKLAKALAAKILSETSNSKKTLDASIGELELITKSKKTK